MTETHVPFVGKINDSLSFGNFEPQIRVQEIWSPPTSLLIQVCSVNSNDKISLFHSYVRYLDNVKFVCLLLLLQPNGFDASHRESEEARTQHEP